MVSKVAIIAIVAILAVPILLGYAMNVEQVTETDYKITGDPVNVTPLLQTGVGHTYASADIYELNSKSSVLGIQTVPIYNKLSSNKSSMEYQQHVVPNWSGGGISMGGNTARYDAAWNYQLTSGYVNALIYENGQVSLTVNRVISIHYDGTDKTVDYQYYTNSSGTQTSTGTFTCTVIPAFDFTLNNGMTSTYLVWGFANNNNTTGQYVDLSSGYYFVDPFGASIDLTQYTKSAIFTIDLNSITDANYTLKIGAGGHGGVSNFDAATDPYYLTKTTTAGVVTWTLTSVPDPSKTWNLYYDPAIPHNTYQIYWDWVYDHSGEIYHDAGLDMDFHDMYYNSHREFRYVGNWPDAIGEANVYWKVTDDVEWYRPMPMPYELPDYLPSNYSDYNFSHIYLNYTGRSPTIRVDAASFRAFEYQVIEDRTLDAASFKSNPSTTIDNINAYGSSFTFGGNTYNVKNGNITMGTHEIPVKGLVLSSVPNPEGGYDNKIGNTVISTTADPSTITFNGRWSASITTSAQEEYEITKTEWKAGDFAWDGMDKNFIMAGLLASLGAFVGVGIYARRTKTSLWPLLIVCGGAALLFFVML